MRLMLARPASVALMTAVALAGCTTAVSAPTVDVTIRPVPSESLAASPVPTEQLFPLGSHFVSPLYGYAMDVPDGWRPQAADHRWNGKPGTFGSGTATSDRYTFQRGYSMWAVGAPTEASLGDFMASQNRADARKHDCPPRPKAVATTIGGEDALLVFEHCPVDSTTVIGAAAVIHDGTGHFFYFIHPAYIDPSNDDRQVFQDILDTVVFQ
jgi:hypothetical protein